VPGRIGARAALGARRRSGYDAPMSDETELFEVALFPIPNAVAFPGVILPLHVFEPRYRRLVQECLDTGRMLGVSHTAGKIHEPKPKESLEEALKSNAATYQPQEIFTAGRCELLETLEDGRMLIQVHMSHRLVRMEETQSLPYRIVTCNELQDEPIADGQAAQALKDRVHTRLTDMVRAQNPDAPEATGALEDPVWASMDPAEYSFRIFQLLRFDADLMQEVLEMTRPEARLELLDSLLASVS
jgi:Lon protease-like protein